MKRIILFTAIIFSGILGYSQELRTEFTDIRDFEKYLKEFNADAGNHFLRASDPETEMDFYWNNSIKMWDTAYLRQNTYAGSDLIEVVEEIYDQNNGIFQNDTRNVYHLNANSELDSLVQYYWSGSAWDISGKYLVFYNANDNVDKIEIYISLSTLTLYESAQHYYDSNNDLIAITYSNLDFSMNFNLTDSLAITLNGNGDASEVMSYFYNSPTWVLQSRNEYVYNGNGNNTEVVTSYYDGTTFVNDYKIEYIFDNNDLNISEIGSYWDNGNWVPNDRYTYTYNGGGNITLDLYEYYDVNVWDTTNREIYVYNTDGDLDSIYSQDHNNGFWNDQDMTKYFYADPVSVKNIVSNEIKLYPNPGIGQLNVSGLRGDVEIRIYNITGEMIFSRKATDPNILQLDLQHFNKGLYFMEIIKGSDKTVKKFTISR